MALTNHTMTNPEKPAYFMWYNMDQAKNILNEYFEDGKDATTSGYLTKRQAESDELMKVGNKRKICMLDVIADDDMCEKLNYDIEMRISGTYTDACNTIAAAVKKSLSDPNKKICRDRLLREFAEMQM